MPWLVLAGSGGLANLVSDIVENPMPPSGGAEEDVTPNMELRERMAEKVKKHFPSEHETDKLVDKVLFFCLFDQLWPIKSVKTDFTNQMINQINNFIILFVKNVVTRLNN